VGDDSQVPSINGEETLSLPGDELKGARTGPAKCRVRKVLSKKRGSRPANPRKNIQAHDGEILETKQAGICKN